jgi:predicted Zn-dependent protease
LARVRVLLTVLVGVALAGGARAGEAAPPSSDGERDARTRQLVDEGLSRFNVGEYDEAARRFTEAYLLEPLPELLYDLAQIAAKQGRREKALEFYRRYRNSLPTGAAPARAIDAKIDDLEAALRQETPAEQAARRLRSGRALLDHGRLDDADEELAGGYALDAQPTFLVALGDVARKRNDSPAAIAHYRRFLEVAPAEDPARPYVHAQLDALTPPPALAAQPPERPSRKRLWWIAAPAAAVVVAGIALGIYFGVSADSNTVPGISISLHK